ncbi:hypothetical protein [Aureispira sp. CCB-QB1]|uniref:hypothetical protein n=1 Tax=Aureispira sp. CCB-QB1 TaxID=1313421 RepID=UPI000698F88F|nr:hypothetical protein [Aureispira sp. CCB-QB1]
MNDDNQISHPNKRASLAVTLIYLGIIIVSFFYVYNRIFDGKINLNGDNISYYLLGQALATGQGYVNTTSRAKQPHRHFPVGYPLVVAAASKVYSSEIIFIKRVNGFLLISAVVILFLLLKSITQNNHISFVVALFCILNSNLLNYSYIMMSEISFLFFSILALWMATKVNFDKPIVKNGLFFMLILCVVFVFHIKMTGLALFLAIATYLLINKEKKYLLAFGLGFIVCSLPWYLRSRSLGGNSHMKSLLLKNPYEPELGAIGIADFIERVVSNIGRYIAREIPSSTFNYVNITSYSEALSWGEFLVGASIVSVMLLGLYKMKIYRSLIGSYLFFFLGILVLWPKVWYGIRFILPIVPLLLFAFVYGIEQLVTSLAQKVRFQKQVPYIPIALLLGALFLVPSYLEPLKALERASKQPYPISYANYFKLANWVNENTPRGSLTCCRKPILFSLYSNKYSVPYKNTLNQQEFIEDLEKKGVDYVVLDQLGYSSTAKYLYPTIKNNPERFEVIAYMEEDPITYLLKFKKK